MTIKLNLREPPAEYKMAMYYLPLASWFNQDQLEKAAPDSPPSSPSASDPASNSAPLID